MTTGPTVQRRKLAAELRRLREQAKLSADDAARAADISKSALWRLEAGSVKPRVPAVRSLLLAYSTDPGLTEVLLELARDSGRQGWWHQYGGAYPDWFEVYVGLEGEASGLRLYQIQLVPGICQTEAYARETIRAEYPKEPAEVIERKVEFRMARQAIFQREQPPEIWMVLDEAALHRFIGNRGVMLQQLERLLEIAAFPTVTLQVLPFEAGAHPAMGTPFTIMLFGRDPEVVYLENYVSALYPERSDQIAKYALGFDHIRAAALAPAPSAALIRKLLKDLRARHED